jgi:hypothetical protein
MRNHKGTKRANGAEETRKGRDYVPEGRGFYAPVTPSGGTRPVPKTESGIGGSPLTLKSSNKETGSGA